MNPGKLLFKALRHFRVLSGRGSGSATDLRDERFLSRSIGQRM